MASPSTVLIGKNSSMNQATLWIQNTDSKSLIAFHLQCPPGIALARSSFERCWSPGFVGLCSLVLSFPTRLKQKRQWMRLLAKKKRIATHQVTVSADLYLNRDPSRIKLEWLEPFWTGPRRRKKAWCSIAHFHKCLQAFGWSSLNTKVCSCSLPLE